MILSSRMSFRTSPDCAESHWSYWETLYPYGMFIIRRKLNGFLWYENFDALHWMPVQLFDGFIFQFSIQHEVHHLFIIQATTGHDIFCCLIFWLTQYSFENNFKLAEAHERISNHTRQFQSNWLLDCTGNSSWLGWDKTGCPTETWI